MKLSTSRPIDFLKVASVCYLFSALVIAASLINIFFIKGFNYGTDFTGGIEIMIELQKNMTESQIRNDLANKNFNVDVEKILSEKNRYVLRLSVKDDEDEIEQEDQLTALLRVIYAKESIVIEQTRIVGGVVSSENKDNSIRIIIIAVICIILYISFRFRWEYGFGAIIAALHDVIIILGYQSFTGMEVGILTITAILTIFGYSVNDTIILYDRIREILKRTSKQNKNNYLNKQNVNEAINSIIVRTFFTSVTTIVVVFALYFNSQAALQDFAAILIIGLISGTYSSIYVACGFLFFWQRFVRKEKI